VLSGEASNILGQSDVIETVVTDTLPVPDEKHGPKLTVLSIAPMLGEAIHRIHGGLSVGAMFES
jgi:ribose-phosphate pyrophosphokinase